MQEANNSHHGEDQNAENLTVDRLLEEVKQLKSQLSRMQSAVGTEPVSGLSNRIAFFERAQEEMLRSRRYGRDMTLVVVSALADQKMKDQHGSDAFDHYVTSLGQMIMSACRAGCDLAGRVTENQFAILLPESDISGCQQFKDRLREQLADKSVAWKGVPLKSGMKLSAGVLMAEDKSFEDLFGRTVKQQVSAGRPAGQTA